MIEILSPILLIVIILIGFGVMSGGNVKALVSTFLDFVVTIAVVLLQALAKLAPPLIKGLFSIIESLFKAITGEVVSSLEDKKSKQEEDSNYLYYSHFDPYPDTNYVKSNPQSQKSEPQPQAPAPKPKPKPKPQPQPQPQSQSEPQHKTTTVTVKLPIKKQPIDIHPKTKPSANPYDDNPDIEIIED